VEKESGQTLLLLPSQPNSEHGLDSLQRNLEWVLTHLEDHLKSSRWELGRYESDRARVTKDLVGDPFW